MNEEENKNAIEIVDGLHKLNPEDKSIARLRDGILTGSEVADYRIKQDREAEKNNEEELTY